MASASLNRELKFTIGGTTFAPLPVAVSITCCASSMKMPVSSTDVVWNDHVPAEIRASNIMVRSALRSPRAAGPIATDLNRFVRISLTRSIMIRESASGSVPMKMPRTSSMWRKARWVLSERSTRRVWLA